MGERPSKNHSLDRFPNNEDGIYEKDNCRWATRSQQGRGQRTNVWIEYKGEKLILEDWAVKVKVNSTTLRRWLKKRSISDILESL